MRLGGIPLLGFLRTLGVWLPLQLILFDQSRSAAFSLHSHRSTAVGTDTDLGAPRRTCPKRSTLSMATNTAVPTTAATSSRSIPKAETDILDLWQTHPKADGRGVKIAILDTGCDLAAAGLQETSQGLPKYLDFLDCTGGGDIDTSKVVEIKSNSTNGTTTAPEGNKNVVVLGLSGRNLTLGSWADGLAKVRLGGVRLYALLPRSVQRRLERERRELFQQRHRVLIAQTQQTLDNLQGQIDSFAGADDDKGEKRRKLMQTRKDQAVLLEHYEAALDAYEDAGPFLDVVLFKDEKDGEYKAILDVEASGNLTEAVPMAPFGKARQMGELGFGSAVTYCIQIYDEGRTLSVVTDAGSHGTHVAGIASAYFPPSQEHQNENSTQREDRNGVAPGAQILACKIGDGRLGSAETGTGLVRALIAAKKYGCDLINLSYGEPSWQPDSGRVAETFADAVHKWGMTVFTSAGNDGPALSSLGSPGTLSAPITVGALVTPSMLVDQYSTLFPSNDEDAPLRDASYYFSSRGPTPDGAFPDLCAPGGAIAPIPRHALQGKAQYHGTSMSSPNACGVAACVLSALEQEGLKHCSPAELRRGLVNSAKPVDIPDPFAQGGGLISATGAVDYIIKNHNKQGQDLTFDVRVPARNNARGIYIRDALELQGPMTFNVNILPRFNHAIERTHDEMEEILGLELDLKLVPSHSWITCPDGLSLLSAQERGGQSFSVRLTGVQKLEAGAHFGTVDAIDANTPERGPLFQIPVTVIVPHSLTLSHENPKLVLNADESITLQDNGVDFSTTYKLLPGAPNRRFIEVPSHAEWVTFNVRSLSPDASEASPQRVLMHAIPFVRGDLPNTEIQLKKLLALVERVEKTFHMKVKGGSTLELCMQLLWLANPVPASVVVDIEFHSLSARAPTLVVSQPLLISPAQGFARFGVAANLRSETLNPKARLTTVRRTLLPSTYDIVAGSKDQDILPPSDAELREETATENLSGTQIYDMFLKYSFKVEEEVDAIPFVPSLFNQLYDSPLDSQIWELTDSNSQVLGYGSSMHHSAAISLKKGDYTLTFHTRHPNRQVLEQMKDTPFQISFILSDKAALDCKIYSELDKASTPSVTGDGRKEIGSKILRKGSFQDMYVARPTSEVPTWCSPGDILIGKLFLDNGVKDATSMDLSYPIPPNTKVKKLKDDKLPEDKEGNKTLGETVFESKVAYLTKQKQDKLAYRELADELQKENSTHLPLLLELLFSVQDGPLKPESKKEQVKAIRKSTENFFVANGGPIDEALLAQYFGVAAPLEDELQEDKEAKALKKKMEEQKKAIQTCRLALSSALGELAASDSSCITEFEESVTQMNKWITKASDLSDSKDKLAFSMVRARHARLCKENDGKALSILVEARKDLLAEASCYKDITQEILGIYRSRDGTEHLVGNVGNHLLKRFPPKTKK